MFCVELMLGLSIVGGLCLVAGSAARSTVAGWVTMAIGAVSIFTAGMFLGFACWYASADD
jgi:hypothetical protein